MAGIFSWLLLQTAVKVDTDVCVVRNANRRNALGRHQVVRNGLLPRREFPIDIGPWAWSMPRVHDERIRFRSSVMRQYVRQARYAITPMHRTFSGRPHCIIDTSALPNS